MRLHIGGRQVREGWSIIDISPGPGVDHVGHCADLSAFASGTVEEIYASHVLEHLDFKDEVAAALGEWRRVLVPSGRLRVSVPDLEVLCRLFVHPKVPPRERFRLMCMMFGGHTDAHDLHKTGFFYELLGSMMHDAGFRQIERVKEFGLFDDTSSLRFGGVLISLNVQASKPATAA